jgi:HSP20 family protein
MHPLRYAPSPPEPLAGKAQRPDITPANKEQTMNALKRWNQLKDLEAFQHGLDSLLGRGPVRRPQGEEGLLAVAEWSPLVDISEDDKEYLIKAELPDVKKEDVKVTAEAGTLTIMGERKFAAEEKGRRYHRVERAYGTFGRSFALPDDASPAKVSAEFKDGLLTVHLVKDEKAKPQQVEVKGS